MATNSVNGGALVADGRGLVSPCRSCSTGKGTGYICRKGCLDLEIFQAQLDGVDAQMGYASGGGSSAWQMEMARPSVW